MLDDTLDSDSKIAILSRAFDEYLRQCGRPEIKWPRLASLRVDQM